MHDKWSNDNIAFFPKKKISLHYNDQQNCVRKIDFGIYEKQTMFIKKNYFTLEKVKSLIPIDYNEVINLTNNKMFYRKFINWIKFECWS